MTGKPTTQWEGYGHGEIAKVATDTKCLYPRFTPFLHTGQRIRVADGDFIRTGTVGITTGWRPAYLLMHRITDRGSWDVLGPRDRITAVKIGRHYVWDQSLLGHLNQETGLP